MNNSRRHFLQQLAVLTGGFALTNAIPSLALPVTTTEPYDFHISLAQWSLHKAFFSKKIDPLDFPSVAKKQFQIDAVEYVNQFFLDKAKDVTFLKELKKRSEDNGVKNLLIMIDQEGSLASPDTNLRTLAVENHYKWVDAAKYLGCHSIRVNLHGEGNEEDWKKASIEGLGKLAEYGSKQQINVIVENHGRWSSKGNLVAEVIQSINNKYCGTLPDFGNFCVRREKGDLWESPCIEWYDRYKGVEEMLPYAKGVSAKSFDFDAQGNETKTDFFKMLSLVKQANYKGYIGIEYEGDTLSEEEGIKATKALLEKVRKQLR